MARPRQFPLTSRCSPSFFCDEIGPIRQAMKPGHVEAISRCPFGFLIDMPRTYGSYVRLEALLSRYDVKTSTFTVGEDIAVPFTAMEFCVVTGLQHYGLHVNLNAKMESHTLAKFFNNEPKKCNRDNILLKFKELVESGEMGDVEDVCRMFILFVFVSLLFPVSSYVLPRGLICYVDNLSEFGEFAWGVAAYNFLIGSIKSCLVKQHVYVNGFTAALMAWFFEHFPSYGQACSLRAFPRFYRWKTKGTSIPKELEKAIAMFDAIDRVELVEIVPTGAKELQLFVAPLGSPVVGLGGVEVLLNEIIKNQKAELALLRQLVGKNGDSIVEEEDVNPENDDARGEEEEAEKEENVEKDVVDENVENEAVEEEVVGEQIVEGKNDPVEGEEDRDLMGDMYSSGEESDDPGRYEIRMKQVSDTINTIASSVRGREDRKPKRKAPDFITPPSSAVPKKKKNKQGKGKEKVDDDACIDFVGRLDYPGKDDLSEEERMKIDAFVKDQTEHATVIVYRDEEVEMVNEDMYRLLWGLETRQSVFEGFIGILQETHSTKVWCMSPHATTAILEGLQKQKLLKGSKKRVKDEDKQALIEFMSSNVSSSVRSLVGRLNPNILESHHFIIFPLNTKFHWHMVVLDTHKKEFKRYNSMLSPFSISHSKLWAKFIRLYLLTEYNYEIPSDEVVGTVCPQQGDESLDCGPYICLFAEALARDEEVFWDGLANVKMSYYRAHLTTTILSSSHSIYSHA